MYMEQMPSPLRQHDFHGRW